MKIEFSKIAFPGVARMMFFMPGVALGLMAGWEARADVIGGASAGTPLTIAVSSTTTLDTPVVSPVSAEVNLNVTPLPTVSGSAPSPYSLPDGPDVYGQMGTSVSVGSPTTLAVTATASVISADVLSNSASSDVDGGPGLRTSGGTSLVEGLEIGFGNISAVALSVSLLQADVIHISASSVSASAEVTGAGAGVAFDASFMRSVADFALSIYGVDVTALLGVDVASDLAVGADVDVTLNLADVVIVVPGLTSLSMTGTIRVYNTGSVLETVQTGSAAVAALRVDLSGISVNAGIESGLNSATVLTTVNGNVAVGEATAYELAPEPSTVLLVLAGGGLLGWQGSRRRYG